MILHYYYEDYIKSKGLSDKEFHDLKEAQTVILNDIYNGIITHPDKGYEIHRRLRDNFLIFRRNHKNFKDFVDYNIEQINSNK